MSFFFQAEDGIRDGRVTGVQTCALPISLEKLAATPASDQPADEAAEEVPDRRCERDRQVGAGSRAEVGAEERDAVGTCEHAGSDGAAHERDELAPDGEKRAEREQTEHGVDAVIRYRRGEAARDAREEHRPDT